MTLPTAQFAPLAEPLAEGESSKYQYVFRGPHQIEGAPLDEWIRCQSSNIWAYHFRLYDPEAKLQSNGDLQIEFMDGAIYLWENVPAAYYLAFHGAPSKGVAHHAWERYYTWDRIVRQKIYSGEALKSRRAANS